jgi:hypothetical protein
MKNFFYYLNSASEMAYHRVFTYLFIFLVIQEQKSFETKA